MSFALDIRKFVEKAKDRADIVVKGTVIGVAAKVDERSPVGDPSKWIYNRGTKENPDYVDWLAYNELNGYVGGRFRGNWQLKVGAMPEGTLDRVDASGRATQSAIATAIPADAAGKVYYLANNLPYAERLETGWSQQAPTGIVSLTVTEFQAFVDKAVADAKAARP